MTELAAAVLCLLLVSALCSGTEAALFSIPLVRARALAEEADRRGRALLAIRQAMARPIATIVVLNNVANIVGSIVVGGLATQVLGETWLGVFSGALTFLVIVGAEIIPKTLGERHAERVGLAAARTVLALTLLLRPVVWLIERVTAPLVGSSTAATTNEAEIKLLARVGKQEGVLEDLEAQFVQRAFRLNDLDATAVMTPRVAMTSLPAHTSLHELQEAILSSQHSRIVVTGRDVDDVRGIVLKYDLMAALVEGRGDSAVERFVRPVHYVPASTRCDALLQHFLRTHEHLAVVVDEYGGVEGVVTLEDVLETLTGEIVDETDRVVDMRRAALMAGAKRRRG